MISSCNSLETSNSDIADRNQNNNSNKETSTEKIAIKTEIYWGNVAKLSTLHLGALYGFYLCFTTSKWQTLLWACFLALFGGFGITGGVHRLWSHRSYNAKWSLRLLLAIAQTVAGQDDIYVWTRTHRGHHKFSETDADPHNSKRGFFFSHIGWLMCKKHPEVIRCGKMVDCSDVLADPIVFYQRKFYIPLVLVFNYVLPTFIPYYFWEESYSASFFIASILRYVYTLNSTWLVNSVAHVWGNHPYDKNMKPAQNKFVSIATLGEGWHNFHHVYPWDYKADELSGYSLNFTALAIDFFCWLGLAYDRRTASKDVIFNRMVRTGDGSHPLASRD